MGEDCGSDKSKDLEEQRLSPGTWHILLQLLQKWGGQEYESQRWS